MMSKANSKTLAFAPVYGDSDSSSSRLRSTMSLSLPLVPFVPDSAMDSFRSVLDVVVSFARS